MYQAVQESLIWIDYNVWYVLHVLWRSDWQDELMPFIRNQWTWAPLYLFLLVFMLQNFGIRGLWWCVFFLLTFAVSDQLSAHLLKPLFHRTRPCNNPALAGILHTVVPCGSGYSFPSSHAANHFALAFFMAVTLQGIVKGIWPITFLWALSVAYAQVYVGVHFPLDVACGGLLGAAVGRLTGGLFREKIGFKDWVLA